MFLDALEQLYFRDDLVPVEGREHQELLLQPRQVQRLHRQQHRLHRLETQVLDYRAHLRQVVLYPLLSLEGEMKGRLTD